MTTPLWIWIVCDGAAHGPYASVASAYDVAVALRPAAIDRARDTRMVHAADRDAAFLAVSWHPQID